MNPDPEPTQLARAIACVSPARLGQQSRARQRLAETYAELECLLPRAGVAIVAALLVSTYLMAPRHRMGCVESKADIARATVKKYALEAYPLWRVQHPNAVCPERLEDLNEYMNNKTIRDEWDGVYEMSCSDFGILVWTAAEDGQPGTADDIRSDR